LRAARVRLVPPAWLARRPPGSRAARAARLRWFRAPPHHRHHDGIALAQLPAGLGSGQRV